MLMMTPVPLGPLWEPKRDVCYELRVMYDDDIERGWATELDREVAVKKCVELYRRLK